jgi:hypothetical protein
MQITVCMVQLIRKQRTFPQSNHGMRMYDMTYEQPVHETTLHPYIYDVIVIGAGHAGCEAAAAAARMGASTLMITIDLDKIGHLSCNPSIGGPAKGHLVREIDALGGVIGRVTDRTFIQMRLLNESKGPAVQALRAQCDKRLYASVMKDYLEALPHLDIRQAMVERIVPLAPQSDPDAPRFHVVSHTQRIYAARSVVVTSGTFLRGDGTWAVAGGDPTTAQVLNATAGASVGAVGTYALLGETSITSTSPGNTRAGSNLRYAGFGRNNTNWTNGDRRAATLFGGSSTPSGTWRAMGYAGSANANDPYDPAVYGATLWLRIS